MLWWLVGCVCCLLLPSDAAAQCRLNPSVSLRCTSPQQTNSVFVSTEDPDYFFPPDHTDRTQWTVEREEPKALRPPALSWGGGREISYHKREVTLSHSCWHLTFRGLSKIALFCRSTF